MFIDLIWKNQYEPITTNGVLIFEIIDDDFKDNILIPYEANYLNNYNVDIKFEKLIEAFLCIYDKKSYNKDIENNLTLFLVKLYEKYNCNPIVSCDYLYNFFPQYTLLFNRIKQKLVFA